MLYDDFKQFPGHWKDGKLYSMMVRCGHLGVSYNTTAISDEEAQSYKCFWKPEIKGKVGHFDWHLPNLGQMSLSNGNGAKLWDIDEAGWGKVKETTMSLRPQVGGFFDYGGTFNGLKNGEMMAMAGIGDWITGVLERDGATVEVGGAEGRRHPVHRVLVDRQGHAEGRHRQEVHPVHDVA